jgi:hypothetical protein
LVYPFGKIGVRWMNEQLGMIVDADSTAANAFSLLAALY